ncbi:PHOTOSYSTEM II STABILITY/ASSEMBLY FACTOR HCF136 CHLOROPLASTIC [Salix purpurea]|uniref:PHOTOSYSTEM II STABILITY/ASSEMBLY FACTOR HCF136 CHLOROPLASTIC n=1 Tax=Salix purpurea TaxID=77065 RepID=A0A9Q0ZI08_SALPP|nr:PHOTOSYSTEM II STABILITY/ASSEMBLY FACTOR HCF136 CHLOROPLASTIC [Salix purpurea]
MAAFRSVKCLLPIGGHSSKVEQRDRHWSCGQLKGAILTTLVNMDGLQLVSMPPRNAFRDDRPKARRGPQPDAPHSIKSCTRNFLETGAWHQSQNEGSNKATRSNEFSDYPSSQSSVTCPDFYYSTTKGCNALSSCEACIDSSNVDKSAKKKCKPKNRRRGKQNKRVSSDAGSTEPEVLSEYAQGSSTSKGCSYNDFGDELTCSATSPEVSLRDASSNHIDFEETFEALDVTSPDGSSSQNDFEGDSIFSTSEALLICTSNIDEVATMEPSIPSIAQNFSGEHQMINTEITLQTKGEGFSLSDTGVKCSSQISCCDDTQSKDFSYASDSSIVFDCLSISSNSDDGTNDSHHVKTYHEGSSRGSVLEAPGFNSEKGSLSHKYSLNGAVDTYHQTEGSKHRGQNFSCSDTQLLFSGKKGKQIKTLPSSSASAHKYGGFGNLHGRTGKENNHSVWKKVQRNDTADECSTEMKISHGCFLSDLTLKEAPSLKRNCIVSDANSSARTEGKKLPKDKVTKKLKRKNIPGSKQEYNCHGRGYSSNKATFNAHAKTGVQQHEIFDLTAQVNEYKGGESISRTHSLNSCLTAGFHPSGVECTNSESVNSSQVSPDALQQLQSTCDTVSSTRHFHTENEGSLPAKLCNSLEQHAVKVPPPVYLPHLFFNKVPQLEKEVTVAEYCKQNHGSGSVMQKWIPIGVKDPELTTSARFGNSLLDLSDGPAGEDLTLRNVQDKANFDSQDLVSSLMLGTCHDSGNAVSLSQEDNHIHKLKNSTLWMDELNKKHVAADALTNKLSDQQFSAFEDESIKIIQSVKDACRVQMESEAIQMATGGPIAEFERFLHLSSPVINLPSFSCCQTCLDDRLVGASLCRHEIPNIPLECIWKWYEEHGNYGLEVRGEECENSNSRGCNHFSFHGYFVPFLSAVQLFKTRASQPINNKNSAPDHEISDAYKASESLANSNAGQLLFEYFELEQPQQRRPLYQKIQELTRGDVSSSYKMYGDPSNLASLNLHDMHPRSWYSVAWYPIYRIPDGHFRAAFLTYHSLGHLVHKSAKVDYASEDASIVSPVVGLQSYNAQVVINDGNKLH